MGTTGKTGSEPSRNCCDRISAAISDSSQRVSVRANVFGFEARELKVSVDPTRVTVVGVKAKTIPATSDYPNQTWSCSKPQPHLNRWGRSRRPALPTELKRRTS